MNKVLALNCLKDFTACLDDKYFLVYGTCLGAIRGNDFIKHDLDIDIGIMRADFNLEFINKIISKGFQLIRLYGMLECGLEMSFKRGGVKIDLMVYYEKDKLIWNSLWDKGGVNGLSDMIIHSYREKVFEITPVRLGNQMFYSLGLEYIKAVYGEHWDKPITPWNWRTDHLCNSDEFKIKIKNIYG